MEDKEDQAVTDEYLQALDSFQKAWKNITTQQNIVDHARRQLVDIGIPRHNGNIHQWDEKATEKLACQLNLLGFAHAELAKCIGKTAETVRLLNTIVLKIQRNIKGSS